ncbi:hypothetical protein [Mycobacterium kansasii]|uniref:hypothetical protein n=1 Tax=Mycobacterium kansasii TaxID=1768 RepID=UPI000F019071|nr:hypothetical protein [Mycobacterium kansasii]VAZ59034.1 hypothetical protein LAUMK22_00826 [Mycobacterium kansasii]
MTLVDGPMAAALAQHRDRCNAIVANARRTYVDFDTTILENQIRGPLRDLVDSCDRISPGSGARVLAAVFDSVVELVGQHRLGGGSHDPLLAALPGLARILLDEPRKVFGSLANAVVHLHHCGLSVGEWLTRVTTAAAGGNPTMTMRAGQVAAWLLGLSQYRDSALSVAATLSDAAFSAAVGVNGVTAADTLQRMRDNRWWRPGRTPTGAPSVVHRVGAFRGFGGQFLSPPRVGVRAGHLVVCSGADAWLLHADAWGATLTRTEPQSIDFSSATKAFVPPGVRPVSVAATADMTALTVPTSYQVLVVEPGR